MDVLHFLKSHHELIRSGLSNLEAVDGVKARRAQLEELGRDIQVHLTLEKDYLYPEIAGLYSGAEALVAAGLANGALISRRLKALVKLVAKPAAEQDQYKKRLAELKDAVLRHFDQEEQILMPKMRAMIRTEDREDLGHVFVDVKAELASAPLDLVGGSTPPRRKRA